MKFQDYQYKRVTVEEFTESLTRCCHVLENASTYNEFYGAYLEANEAIDYLLTMSTLANIRFTINTKDEFYVGEKAFWDESEPLVEELLVKMFKVIQASAYVNQLKTNVPNTFFLIGEFKLKQFSEEIVTDLQEENRLCSEYEKIIGGAEFEFMGETHNTSSIGRFINDQDASIRKAAYEVLWGYFESKEDEIDTIFDQLVKLRDKIARKLGFTSFTELGYIRMKRFDYDAADVENYRKQVLKDVVPVAQALYQAQMKRLGEDTLECFNNDYSFVSGNPTPKHNKDTMVKIAQNMYRDLSPETAEFWDFMMEHDLLDLEAKPGKGGGGYCTYLPNFKAPFIFSNFNGTQGDVDVLTHEAGHAFQCYESRPISPTECVFPTSESAEIHSMSMEFFAWPWMKEFFGEDAEKYYYTHLGGAVQFLPYGVCVDHFQHEIYANVDMTPAERKATWRRLEKMYLPHKNYDAIPMLEKGTWWFKQLHIFLYPFYYIDYTLAQVCALQFWNRLQKNDETAWADYLKICKIGGSDTFKNIVHAANLNSPFEDGCLTEVMATIGAYLEASPCKDME